MSLWVIEYDEDDYEVLSTKDINDNSVRTIKYSTGYYGLQLYIDSIGSNVKTWKTVYVCPKKDVEKGLGSFYEGQYYINCLLGYIEDSIKLHNGEYWELVVQARDDESFEVLKEVVKREDGEVLLRELFKLNKLQQKSMIKYCNDDFHWRILICFNVLIYIIIAILWFFKIGVK